MKLQAKNLLKNKQNTTLFLINAVAIVTEVAILGVERMFPFIAAMFSVGVFGQ